MSRFKLDHFAVVVACVLLFAFPPAMFRDLELLRDGERIDLTTSDFSEARVYDLELTWQKRFWQGSIVEIWVDDCLRSLVVNGHDISTEWSYCDFVGSRSVDLSPYLVGGRATLEIEVENLGGPGGLTIQGVGNAFFRTFRFLLSFFLILVWLYRNGRTEDRAGRAEPAGLAMVLRTYRWVLFGSLFVIAWACFVWFREAPPRLTPGAAGVGAPSWAEDIGLNPRILIEGGEFLMGSPEGVAYNDEQPQRRVEVSGFWMQQYEVTNEEYRRFKPAHGFTHGLERYPVVNVTWHEALAYAEWLGGSLPTEAQWEFAARGPRGRKYPWGDEEPSCARANFNECGWRLEPVGSHPAGATAKGVEDLAGNAWEWTADWYSDRYLPGDQADPGGVTSGSVRVFRGGSFIGGPGYLRSAYRGHYLPGFLGHDIGLRVVWPAAKELD